MAMPHNTGLCIAPGISAERIFMFHGFKVELGLESILGRHKKGYRLHAFPNNLCKTHVCDLA